MNSKLLKAKSYKLKAGRGFSLVEVILAGAVFILLVTAFIGAYLYGQESTAFAGNKARAAMLAQEGLEAVRNIRDAGYVNLTDGTFGLTTTGNQWNLAGSSDTTDIFIRQMTISSVDAKRKNVVATVTWQQHPQRAGSVQLTTYLTNWIAQAGLGASTCLIFCTSNGYTNAACRPIATTCQAHGEVHEPLGDPICVVTSPGTALCCCQP